MVGLSGANSKKTTAPSSNKAILVGLSGANSKKTTAPSSNKVILVGLSGADSKKMTTLVQHLNYVTETVNPIVPDDPNYPINKKIIQLHRRFFSANEKKRITYEYESGARLIDLARQYNCHKQTISRLLKAEGVYVGRKQRTIIGSESKILAMYKSGLSTYNIADKLSLYQKSVLRFLHKQGVKLRTRADY